MNGDFSRLDVAQDERFDGVLHQQGRLWLDSDWNADVFARLARIDRETRDVVGAAAFPYPARAFELTASADPDAPDDLGIGGGAGADGRCYVDGILCRAERPATYLSQPDLPNPPRVAMPLPGERVRAIAYLDVWRRLITYLQDDAIREVALGGPDTATRVRTIAQVKFAVLDDGTVVDCASASGALPPLGAGTLSSWAQPPDPEDDPCSLPDPRGYTGDANRLYRVQVHDGGDVEGVPGSRAFRIALASDAGVGATSLSLAYALSAVQRDALLTRRCATLLDDAGRTARVDVVDVVDGTILVLRKALTETFTVADGAVCRGGAARFVWSRNNGSNAVAIVAVAHDRMTVTLAQLGRDRETALRAGDLVEVADDASELGPARGFLTWLATDPDPDTLSVTLADPLPPAFVPSPASAPHSPPYAPVSGLLLRAWDGDGLAAAAFDPRTTPDLDLGDGVRIAFGGSNLLPGDYWQFIARAIDASVQTLRDAPPAGIARHRTPLAIVEWNNDGGTIATAIDDCRSSFSPLVELAGRAPAMHVVALDATDAGGETRPLRNDTEVTPTQIAGGIAVRCDDAIDPVSVKPATAFATLQMPSTQQTHSTVTIDAMVGADGDRIVWDAGTELRSALFLLRSLAAASFGVSGIPLLRLRLIGERIWSARNAAHYLDGQTLGIGHGGSIALRFPSGGGVRASDFEAWFEFVPDPQQSLAVFVSDRGGTGVAPAIDVIDASGLAGAYYRAQSLPKFPRGVAVAPNGALYVGRADAPGSIMAYPPGTFNNPTTLTGVQNPNGLRLGVDGTLYAVDRYYDGNGNYMPRIVYWIGASGAAKYIYDPLYGGQPLEIAVDDAGYLFVTEDPYGHRPAGVLILPPIGQAKQYTWLTSEWITSPWGIALGPRDNELFVVNRPAGKAPPHVAVFEHSVLGGDNVKPKRVIAGSATGLTSVWGCALDASGYLYVANAQNVLVFAPRATGNAAPVAVIPPKTPFADAIYIATGPP